MLVVAGASLVARLFNTAIARTNGFTGCESPLFLTWPLWLTAQRLAWMCARFCVCTIVMPIVDVRLADSRFKMSGHVQLLTFAHFSSKSWFSTRQHANKSWREKKKKWKRRKLNANEIKMQNMRERLRRLKCPVWAAAPGTTRYSRAEF